MTVFCNFAIIKYPFLRIRKDNMNYCWVVEKKDELKILREKMYASNGLYLSRKRKKLDFILSYSPQERYGVSKEDEYLRNNRRKK